MSERIRPVARVITPEPVVEAAPAPASAPVPEPEPEPVPAPPAPEPAVEAAPEPLAFDPTARTIERVIAPRGLPYRVVVNNWDPRDGTTDLQQTAQYIRQRLWPMCNTVVRRYKLHTRASADGLVVTQYPKNRVAMEAREDFFRLALELRYGGSAAEPTAAGKTVVTPPAAASSGAAR